MGMKDYTGKARTCVGGLSCCGTSYGPQKTKRRTRRHQRRVEKNLLKRKLMEDEGE
jgi:hypothetical protein